MNNLCSYTHLAFLINSILDNAPDTWISFSDVLCAAQDGHLVDLLATRCGHPVDFYLLTCNPTNLEQVEAALRDAAAALEGRELGKARIGHNGLCLAMAIVLEAIQEQFHNFSHPPSEPEADADQSFLPPWNP